MTWYGHLTLGQKTPPPADTNPPAKPVAPGSEGQTLQPGGDNGTHAAPSGGFKGPEIYLLVGFVVIFWFLILMPQKREKKKHAQMMSGLKKGDRVQTIGGMLGTVVEVRDDQVILKVDENNNTRLRFTRAAIQGILGEEKE